MHNKVSGRDGSALLRDANQKALRITAVMLLGEF